MPVSRRLMCASTYIMSVGGFIVKILIKYLECMFCTEGRLSGYEKPPNVSEDLISGLKACGVACP
jgi:hypothetical protein